MRLIDADYATKHWQDVLNVKFYEDDYAKGFQAGLLAVINTPTIDTPTIDAVPVVRCKDCKYYQKTQACRYHSENELPFGFDVFVCPNDFCSYGERKESV